jgi:kynurenine formamidase
MKWKPFIVCYALALTLLLVAQRHPNQAQATPAGFSAVVDLTHLLDEKAPNWEGSKKSPFEARQVASIQKDGYFARTVCLPEHFATHIDAPAHFAPGLWTVDQIPTERLIASLVVIDVSGKVRGDPDYQLGVADVAEWEKANGQIPQGALVLARTGWDSRWSSMQEYRNADAKGVMHFPGYSREAARFLVEGRNIVGLGIDTLSVDAGEEKSFPVHRYTMRHSLYHVENVTNLDRVPEAGAVVVVAPAKLAGGSGGPVRVLALLK